MSAVYNIEKSRVFGLAKQSKSWELVDTTKGSFELTDLYHEIEVGLTDIHGNKKSLKLSRHYAEITNTNLTIEAWLERKRGDVITCLVDGWPVLNYGQSQYINLAGAVHVAMAPRNVHPTQDFAMDDARDLIIEPKEGSSLKYLYNNLLYNINGAWVHSHYTGNTVALYGAGDVVKTAANTNLAALDFSQLGGVETTLLKDLNYSLLTDNVPHLNNALLITVGDNEPNHTYMLSVCGVLYDIPSVDYISDDVVSISLGKLNIHDLIIDTRNRYDWGFLNIFNSDGEIIPDVLLSRKTLYALFDHESCFVVKVNVPNAVRSEVFGLESVLVNHNRIKLDINTQLGFMVDNRRLTNNYWPIPAGKYWQLYFREDDGVNKTMNTTGWVKSSIGSLQPDILNPYTKLEYRMYNYFARTPPYTEK